MTICECRGYSICFMQMRYIIPPNKVILLIGDHYQTLGLLRSLGESGIKPIVVYYGKGPLIPNSKYSNCLIPVKDAQNGLDYIIDHYGNEKLKPFLFASSDKDAIFLDTNYDRLIDKFYFSHCGEKGRLTKFMNKDENTHLAEKYGIQLPKEEQVMTGELPTTLKYPVITKAVYTIEGAWKGDMYICQNEDELKEAYKKIKSPRLLVQEYIDKKNELSINGMSIGNGECIMPFVTDYIRFYKNAYGHYMTFHKFEEDNELWGKIQSAVKEMKFSGLFEAELLLDKDDKQYFLEINLRHTTWGHGITYGGVNLPYLWIMSTLSGHIDKSCLADRRDDYIAMVEPIDYLLNVKRGNYSAVKWWRDLFRCDFTYFYNKKDPKPFWKWLQKNYKQFIFKNITH